MSRRSINQNFHSQKGFTLVEVALVLVVGGIILGMLASALIIYIDNAQLKTTERRIQMIDEAIEQFFSFNGRYPCPTGLDTALDTPDFGREVNACGVVTGAPTGTTNVTTAPDQDGNTQNIRIGAVPVRTLNLPDDFIGDAWGNRFTYAVVEAMAAPAGFDPQNAAISVVDQNGNPVTTPINGGRYVIVSHGEDGLGAFSAQGVAGIPCAVNNLDTENCDNDATFLRTFRSDAAGNIYDDMITVRAATTFDSDIPAGAVVAFNLSACPNGWQPYVQGIGRTIIGSGTFSGSYTEDTDPDLSIPGDDNWNDTAVVYPLGVAGGYATWPLDRTQIPYTISADPILLTPDASGTRILVATDTPPVPAAHDNMPPYVPLLYCQRD